MTSITQKFFRPGRLLIAVPIILLVNTIPGAAPIINYAKNKGHGPKYIHRDAAYNDLVMTTVDVGQGLCQVITFENVIILSDCGSSSAWRKANEGKLTASSIIRGRVNRIYKKLIEKSEKLKFCLVVSHDDTDHTSLMKDIVEYFFIGPRYNSDVIKKHEKKISNIDYRIILPQHKTKVDSIFNGVERKYKKIVKNHERRDNFKLLKYTVNYSSKKVRDCSGKTWQTRIHAAGGQRDKNDASIVFSVSQKRNEDAGIPYWGLLSTGDATLKTNIRGIYKYAPKFILVGAPHHGADTHGSDKIYKRNIAEENRIIIATIFSAAYNGSYMHPRCSVVRKLTKIMNGGTDSGDSDSSSSDNTGDEESNDKPTFTIDNHYLSCGVPKRYNTDENLEEIPSAKSDFPLFNTCNSGHITAHFKDVSSISSGSTSSTDSTSSEEDEGELIIYTRKNERCRKL